MAVVTVTGTTPEERAQTRADRTAARRRQEFDARMQAALTPRRRLEVACEYVRAAADDAPDEMADEWARSIADLVEGGQTR